MKNEIWSGVGKTCKSCGVTYKKKHLLSCSRKNWMGKPVQPKTAATPTPTIPLTQQVLGTPVPEPPPTKLTNHIVFLLDASGSMFELRQDVIRVFNDNIAKIQQKAVEMDQITYLDVYAFNDEKGIWPLVKNQYTGGGTIRLDSHLYHPTGGTPLLDSMKEIITAKRNQQNLLDRSHSFLFITITDGQENTSRRTSKDELARVIHEAQGTDVWTFAVMCPDYCVGAIKALGIPAGNIQAWETTRRGLETSRVQTQNAVGQYYGARAMGATKSTGFFQTNMTGVDPTTLPDVTKNFLGFTVDKECQISDFVNGRIHASGTVQKKVGAAYKPGYAYYELTKKEDVQPYKDILIKDRKTGKIWGGADARRILGMPDGLTLKVEPGNHQNYKLFVASTSMNRKLVRGTELLYRTS
jgi:hypothetical protein